MSRVQPFVRGGELGECGPQAIVGLVLLRDVGEDAGEAHGAVGQLLGVDPRAHPAGLPVEAVHAVVDHRGPAREQLQLARLVGREVGRLDAALPDRDDVLVLRRPAAEEILQIGSGEQHLVAPTRVQRTEVDVVVERADCGREPPVLRRQIRPSRALPRSRTGATGGLGPGHACVIGSDAHIGRVKSAPHGPTPARSRASARVGTFERLALAGLPEISAHAVRAELTWPGVDRAVQLLGGLLLDAVDAIALEPTPAGPVVIHLDDPESERRPGAEFFRNFMLELSSDLRSTQITSEGGETTCVLSPADAAQLLVFLQAGLQREAFPVGHEDFELASGGYLTIVVPFDR